jgi:hypothetical protein
LVLRWGEGKAESVFSGGLQPRKIGRPYLSTKTTHSYRMSLDDPLRSTRAASGGNGKFESSWFKRPGLNLDASGLRLPVAHPDRLP